MVNNKYNKLLYKKYNIKYNVEKKAFGGTKRDERPSELNSSVKKIKITDGRGEEQGREISLIGPTERYNIILPNESVRIDYIINVLKTQHNITNITLISDDGNGTQRLLDRSETVPLETNTLYFDYICDIDRIINICNIKDFDEDVVDTETLENIKDNVTYTLSDVYGYPCYVNSLRIILVSLSPSDSDTLFENISGMSELHTLKLTEIMGINNIPQILEPVLSNLLVFDIRGTHSIIHLPDYFRKIKVLILADTNITNIDNLNHLENLKLLDIRGCEFTNLPDILMNKTDLKVLVSDDVSDSLREKLQNIRGELIIQDHDIDYSDL
jgi:hypothetical protein